MQNKLEAAVKKIFVKKNQSRVSLVRVATHFHELDKTFQIIKIIKKLGYKVALNLMQISELSEKDLVNISNKINKNKIVMMPYVVNNDLFSIKKRIKNKKIKILYAGKLIKRKGVDILLKSILNIKNNYNLVNKFELMIVGDGHMRDYLVNYIKLKKLTNIKIMSFKNEKELSKIYQKSDIFIMPSYFEPWGLTINEALASENAIICSNKVGSSYDLVHQGKNGYLFKEKSYKSLASKIIKLVENKKRINLFKKESLKIISKWSFNECQLGLKKAINKINQLS